MTDEISERIPVTAQDSPSPAEDMESKPLYQLLLRVLGRTPTLRDVEIWEDRLDGKIGIQRFIENLMRSKPVQRSKFVPMKNPPGHYFSPVVDPDLVQDYVGANRKAGAHDLGGIDFHLEDMVAFWERNRAVIAQTPFPEQPDPAYRYCSSGGAYGLGDATTLRAMIADLRPRRIVEIGGGYSTALMLDTMDELRLDTLSLTCIEPNADRLRALLRPGDDTRMTLIEEEVQTQPAALFAALEANDILFVDSSHVMKTGSDVHHVLFSILPLLKPGVVIHFHDCRFPLEYSDAQIFKKNYSWNEAYAVRALLMYSTRFRVVFSGSLFARSQKPLIKDTYAPFLINPGSALWLRVMEDGARTNDTRQAAETHRKPTPAVTTFVETPISGDPDHAKCDTHIKGTPVSFHVRTTGTGPVFFSMGVRKSGSTLLHKITAALARENDVNMVDVPGTFFSSGLSAADWMRGFDWDPLMRPQNILTGFRSFPTQLAQSQTYRGAKKVFMYRNPMDALVSQYFSDAFSHSLPKRNENAEGRERFEKKREEAQNVDINDWVLTHAPSLQSTMLGFLHVLEDPNCLVLQYEDMIFHKDRSVDEIVAHFGWTIPADAKADLLASVDVVPTSEDKKRFVRKVVPGDHKDKLSPETIEALQDSLGKTLTAFGYAT